MADVVVRNPKAKKIIETLFPTIGLRRFKQLEALDPEYRDFLENSIYGGLYAREVLDQKTRELCALASLVTLCRNVQIRSHVLASLNAGATRQEIIEVIFQMAVYAGFPVVLNGLEVAENVFKELDNPAAP